MNRADSDIDLGARFSVVRRIGAGGMGKVYEATDTETGDRVAIKTLLSREPSRLHYFKREFRALQDIRHPNLVGLGELLEHRGTWYFTAELVDGCDFLAYVGARNARADDDVSPTEDTLRGPSAVPSATAACA